MLYVTHGVIAVVNQLVTWYSSFSDEGRLDSYWSIICICRYITCLHSEYTPAFGLVYFSKVFNLSDSAIPIQNLRECTSDYAISGLHTARN